AGGHGAAVAVPQRNAHGLELENLTGRTLCDGVDFDSLLGDGLLENPSRVAARRYEERSGRVRAPVRLDGLLQPEHVAIRGEQPVDCDEHVVLLVTEQESGVAAATDLRRHLYVDALDALERSVEAVEDAIELDAHLERERPARRIVRRCGCGARI